MEKATLERLKKNSISILQFLFFPVHLAMRSLVRVPLLILTLYAILIPLIITVILPGMVLFISEQLEKFFADYYNDVFLDIVLFVGSLGIYSYLLNNHFESIKASLCEIVKNLLAIFRYQWIPELDFKKSLTETWEQIKKSCSNLIKTLKRSLILALSILMITALGTLIFHTDITQSGIWQTSFMLKLETFENQLVELINIHNQPQTNVIKKLETIENKQTVVINNLATHHEYSVSAHNPPHPPPHVVFSLVYPPQGDLVSKTGICPDEEGFHNLEWLRMFKTAIAQCSEAGPRLKLEVMGFSSIAPVAAAGSYDASNLMNCEIANQRAEAVVGFLVEDEYRCDEFLNNSLWERKGNNLCTRKMDEHNFGSESGLAYDLTYRPWQSYDEMEQSRPVNDGNLGGERRHPSEIMNRVVQIIVKNNSCWREQWMQHIE